MCFLSIMEARSKKSRCQQGCSFWRLWGTTDPCLCPRFWWQPGIPDMPWILIPLLPSLLCLYIVFCSWASLCHKSPFAFLLEGNCHGGQTLNPGWTPLKFLVTSVQFNPPHQAEGLTCAQSCGRQLGMFKERKNIWDERKNRSQSSWCGRRYCPVTYYVSD